MKRIPARVLHKAAKIRLLLLDVDGVLTDGRIIIDNRGVETKQFDVRDGQGIALLKRAGIEVGLITSRSSKAVIYRARELGLRMVYQGVASKSDAYGKIRRKAGLDDAQIGYVGDDIIDLPILHRVGFAATVRDGWPGLLSVVDYVTEHSGGKGAVREVAEILLKSQNHWTRLVDLYRSS